MKRILEWLGLRKPAHPVCETLDSLERLLREIQNLSLEEQVAITNRVDVCIHESLFFSEVLESEIRSAIRELLNHAPEDPTSACWDCGGLVRPEELSIGKQSGTALCEYCLGIWVAAGRAKYGGEF